MFGQLGECDALQIEALRNTVLDDRGEARVDPCCSSRWWPTADVSGGRATPRSPRLGEAGDEIIEACGGSPGTPPSLPPRLLRERAFASNTARVCSKLAERRFVTSSAEAWQSDAQQYPAGHHSTRNRREAVRCSVMA